MENVEPDIELLKKHIENYDYHYYVKNDPIVSDQHYDDVMSLLITLENEHPEYKTIDSPTNRVSSDILESFEQSDHKYKMLSIDNSYNYDNVKEFSKKVETLFEKGKNNEGYIAELKLDGLAINLQYTNGYLTKAVTRGDGDKGDDVTQNIKLIRTVPLKLNTDNPPEYVEIRGEVTMSKDEFERLNKLREESGEKLLANCRNAAAGSLKQLDINDAKKRKLFVSAFECYPHMFSTRTEIKKQLEDWGFYVNKHSKHCTSIEEVISFCEEWNEKRKNLNYDTDGIVIKVNSIELCNLLGNTGHAPRYMIAYKYPAEVATTKLNSITIQCGKSGILTPVAELEPVKLCGTIVKRASLYNFDYLKDKDLRIGDTVYVQKAGEIIPQVTGKVDSLRPENTEEFKVPTNCPVCNSLVMKDDNGVFYRCTGTNCQAQVLGKISDFVAKHAMDIEGIGPSLIELLLEKEIISNISDLYNINYDDLLYLDGIGSKKIENIKNSIEKSKSQPFERVLVGLSIPNVGRTLSPILAKTFKNIDVLSNTTTEELKNINDIGEVVANCIVDWFKDNSNLIKELKKVGLNMEYEENKNSLRSNKLNGKNFIATGKLNNFTRQSINDSIISNGGNVVSSITAKTDYLIVGDKAGSKLQKAEKLGVTTITEDEYIVMIQ